MSQQHEFVENIFQRIQSNDLGGLTGDVRFHLMHTHENENRPIDIYFDTSSVIDLHIGIEAVYRANQLDHRVFNNHSSLVHAMAYDGWLGKIHLLPKHKEEFILKLSTEDRLFPSKPDLRKCTERKYALLAEFAAQLPNLNAPLSKMKQELGLLKENALLIYYLIFLVKEQGNWSVRHKSLIGEGDKEALMSFENKRSSADTQYIKSKLFRQLFNCLSQERSTKSINNYQDAIALCQLNERLRKNELDKNAPIPVFYSSQQKLIDAVKKVVTEFYADEKELPFHYVAHDGCQYFIIRDSDYFIINGVSKRLSQLNREKDLVEFKHSLIKFEEQTKISSYPVDKKTAFNKSAYNLSIVKSAYNLSIVNFMVGFMESWLSKNAADELATILEDIKDPEQLQLQLNEFISQVKEKLSAQNEAAQIKNNIIRTLWVDLGKVTDRLYNERMEIVWLPTDAVELEARFGYKTTVRNKVEKILTEINNNLATEFEHKHNGIIFNRRIDEVIVQNKADIITDIIEGFEADDLTQDPKELDDKTEKLMIGIGALWMLDRYRTIDHICKAVTQKKAGSSSSTFNYPDYRIALIHAAAILNGLRNQSRAEKVIEEITIYANKLPAPSYKIQIGFSYLYSILWEIALGDDPHLLPERAMKDAPETITGNCLKYLKKGEQAALHALQTLEEHMKNPDLSDKNAHYLKKKYYLYNNIIFLRTYGSSAEEFLSAETRRFKERLYNSFNSDLAQPARFHDTLARYYLRTAALESYDSPTQQSLLAQAKQHSDKSIGFSQKQKTIYEQLRQEIAGVMFEEWFKNVQPFVEKT